MYVMGIDPGIATTGWAILNIDGKSFKLVDFGVITTDKELSNSERLHIIHNDLNEIISQYKPVAVAVETLLFQNNARTAMAVGEARGVILLTLVQSGIKLYQFTPLQVKKSITGRGNADKKSVQESVKILCKLEKLPKPDDAADAVALALCARDSYIIDSMK